MRWRGLEPPRPQWPLGPQPSASTNSATSAWSGHCSRGRLHLMAEDWRVTIDARRETRKGAPGAARARVAATRALSRVAVVERRPECLPLRRHARGGRSEQERRSRQVLADEGDSRARRGSSGGTTRRSAGRIPTSRSRRPRSTSASKRRRPRSRSTSDVAEWEVRVELRSHHDAEAFAAKLEGEGDTVDAPLEVPARRARTTRTTPTRSPSRSRRRRRRARRCTSSRAPALAWEFMPTNRFADLRRPRRLASSIGVELALERRRARARATAAATGPGRASRAARRRGSPGRRSRSRPGSRRASGSRSSGSTCGPARGVGRRPSSTQPLEPRRLLRLVGDAPGDVVRRARRRSAPAPRPARANESGASVREEPGVEIGVADHDDVAQRRRARRERAAAAARPDPRPRARSRDRRRLTSPIDSSVPRPSRPRSARGHSKNVISVPGAPISSPK